MKRPDYFDAPPRSLGQVREWCENLGMQDEPLYPGWARERGHRPNATLHELLLDLGWDGEGFDAAEEAAT